MTLRQLFRPPTLLVFGAIFVFGLAWAIYTNHAWEDYYITYRASKNLAVGNGLTFTAGERVHSFTSPLGVLLPALASLLTGNRSDDGALWIFRVMSLTAYAGAGVVLYRLTRSVHGSKLAAVVMAVLFAIDSKIVDFSTNGMETGFLMLFVAWTLHAMLLSPRNQSLQLGLAWAGLMWTRPDSFVYIGALALGTLMFCPPAADAGGRLKLLKTFISAGVITTVVYAPWLLWAWSYYGTPVPNTITAKGLFHDPVSAMSLLKSAADFPKAVTTHFDMLATTFMPPYSGNTGWPAAMLRVAYWIGVGCLVTWLIPGVRRETRLASFAFCIGQFYIASFVFFPVPWYMPTLTLFALFTLAGLVAQFADILRTRFGSSAVVKIAPQSVAVLLVGGALSVTLLAAHQLKIQQAVIERGQRERIGRWLRENASTPRDTVFLECLGYIGFYSNLKMLDYPGLSSPEVIAARRRVTQRSYPDSWSQLVLELSPDWLVLRDYEAAAIRRLNPDILGRFYKLTQTFDVRDQVNAIPFIMGRNYLVNDAYFEVYHRSVAVAPEHGAVARVQFITTASLEHNEAWGGKAYDSMANIVANAPSRLVLKKPAGARWLTGGFGIFEGAYQKPLESSDGADFRVFLTTEANAPRRELFHRFLNPRDIGADRGLQSFSVELPVNATGTLELVVTPGPNGNDAYDWAYWSQLVLEFPRRD